MIFNIYDPPDGLKKWNELCVGCITDVSDWEYEKYFCDVGTFRLTTSYGANGAAALKLGRFILTNDGGFIIKRLKYNTGEITVSGYDLNGLLLDRLTVARTEDGKDRQGGSTEKIVKHYVEANCVNAFDAGRNFPGLAVAENKDRGIDDAASPRLQCVADVVSDILAAQKMGWRVSANYPGSPERLMTFEISESKNRVWGQSENRPISFSYGLGTTDKMNSERSIDEARNTLYCELEDGAVQTYSPVSDNVGYSRAEEFADLNCRVSEVKIYAEHEIAERFGETHSITLEHVNSYKYGEDFELGDIVTVCDKNAGITLEALITSVKIKRSNGEFDVSVTIGETRAKLIDRVAKSVAAVSNGVKGSVVSKVVFPPVPGAGIKVNDPQRIKFTDGNSGEAEFYFSDGYTALRNKNTGLYLSRSEFGVETYDTITGADLFWVDLAKGIIGIRSGGAIKLKDLVKLVDLHADELRG